MQDKPIDILNFRSCSLFSTQEYKIDSGNLHIIDSSPGTTEKEIIPLDLIDPNPKISKKNNEQLLWSSVGSFTIGMLFILLSVSADNFVQQILGLGFIGIGAIFLMASLKLQTTSYTYYYANTATQLFTIKESQESDAKHARGFVQSLNLRINKPVLAEYKRKSKEENYSEFMAHLDFLYNYGVMTDAQYERIHNKIDVKVLGNKPAKAPQKTADIITLPLRRHN